AARARDRLGQDAQLPHGPGGRVEGALGQPPGAALPLARLRARRARHGRVPGHVLAPAPGAPAARHPLDRPLAAAPMAGRLSELTMGDPVDHLSVSVVIPTFERATLVPRAVHSALDAVAPGDEVIVVDDGSTDGTEAVLAPYRDRLRYVRTAHRG